MKLLAAFFNSQWRWVAGVLAVVFAGLLLTQSADYARAWLARRRLGREQTTAEAARGQHTAASTARYQRYQVDSAARAAERRQLQRDALLSQQADEALSTNRPERVPLPEQPPRE